ncbi:hypothetical protein L0P88_17435 [Muricauda sp. SCSIO 64092]|uniref:hypothetical protein n=1 Tax=Allomuricauda sp. SCSIO 64092 TaxID=2908842 RepID=UPI001FF33E57|nr:hypothetical protein [Muricauda sp. SCSIO 64092]UOY05720.1 hypothetical protein L0P88_17435 [Muricauda sp. SCSIO 64092]
MMFDKYSRTARLYPAIITLLPFMLLSIHLSNTELSSLFKEVLAIKITANMGAAVVLLYLLMQANRYISKVFFEKRFFKGELEMPTTRFMLFSDNEYSEQKKEHVRNKVKNDFNFDMPDFEIERSNEIEAKKLIAEAVGLIRNKVKDGNLLLQHNIEYGFFRNLIGGSVLGSITAITGVVYFYKVNAHWGFLLLSISLSVVFLLLVLFSKRIINYFGKLYAKRLFIEYL